MPVILFHAGFAAFAGGYLGVDIFFVISGYLITGILLRDLRAGRFSLARFYERRARRILPALAFVLLACVPVAVAWLSPPELRDFAASFLATALSVSNFVFWQELDYFGPAAEHLPLLHTWTLGIEEQFYILFPLALAALWRGPRRHTRAILAAALVASLAAAAWAARTHPSTGFFLLPFRAWELLIGALAAIVVAPAPLGAPRPRRARRHRRRRRRRAVRPPPRRPAHRRRLRRHRARHPLRRARRPRLARPRRARPSSASASSATRPTSGTSRSSPSPASASASSPPRRSSPSAPPRSSSPGRPGPSSSARSGARPPPRRGARSPSPP